ncbi:MAG: hypothetical protein ACFFC7_20145 [Candidatus Hermodarchaeota archaeon]
MAIEDMGDWKAVDKERIPTISELIDIHKKLKKPDRTKKPVFSIYDIWGKEILVQTGCVPINELPPGKTAVTDCTVFPPKKTWVEFEYED